MFVDINPKEEELSLVDLCTPNFILREIKSRLLGKEKEIL